MKPTKLFRHRQGGAISVLLAVLLIAGVLLILGQTLVIMSTRSSDTLQQLDSNSALMLAESGLQRAHGAVKAVAGVGTMSNATCAAIAAGPFALGRGTFTLDSGVTTPATCDELVTGCDTCKITATGKVNAASRTLSQTYHMGVTDGVAGKGQTVTMVLKNTWDTPAVSLFNMGWKRQEPGGNADATYCANGATDCGLQYHLESSNGSNSAGAMGVTVKIPPLTLSKVVVQTISQSRHYVEVGALFGSVNASYPAIRGTFWSDVNGNSTKTAALSNQLVGGVNNGVIGGSGACTAAPATYPTGGGGITQAATCTNWCTAADTLVFGVAARSATVDNKIDTIRFNSSGASPVFLSKLVHFPAMDGTTPDAEGFVYSEIWYTYNPQYTSATPSTGTPGATSYSTAFTGSIGAALSPVTIGNGATSMPVVTSNFSGSNGRICVGDTVARTDGQDRFAPNTIITSTPGGSTCSSIAGNYGLSAATSNDMNGATIQVSSTKLLVTPFVGTVGLGTATSSSGTVIIESGPTGGYYTLSAATATSRPTPQTYTQGSSGPTITTPAGTAPSPGTIVAVYSGTGQLEALSTVLSSTSTSFTVSAPPVTGLRDAIICGGTCAFFNSPSVSTSETAFTITKTANTAQWSGGFVCLSGVDPTRIRKITATTLAPGRWQQAVQ